MNERIKELRQDAFSYAVVNSVNSDDYFTGRNQFDLVFDKKFAELIIKEYASEYNRLINGEAVVLPKDREHAQALVRVGMFYLENNK